MPIDPIISLAFAMQSNKGVYALLLGSGVSRSAGIPTGWEMVLDLIRKMATLAGADCEPDPPAWYAQEFGEEPDYGKLLNAVAKVPSERQGLLRSYFEPTAEEREDGLKLPRDAHRAIAELVQGGYVRVIITTNFDRLIEPALEEIGIIPTVISTADQAKGARPITHSECTIIKVHGDYLDTRIKNTPKELAKFDTAMDQLVDRVLDEFGLIVCGWSAEWDTALRGTMERCPSHRFTTYWTLRGAPRGPAQKLIQQRRATVITIADADQFFRELAEKVSALEDLAQPHPLSVKTAVTTLKRYLADDQHRIRLRDLIMQEAERLYEALATPSLSSAPGTISADEFNHRVAEMEARTEILRHLFATGCYWGKPPDERIWIGCLERLGNPPGDRSGGVVWLKLRSYPAQQLLYAGGMGSIAAEKYTALATLLITPTVAYVQGERTPAALLLFPVAVMEKDHAQLLPGLQQRHTPLSDHLCDLLREPLREYLPDDQVYEQAFDRFEYMLSLVHADLDRERDWVPVGRFAWRHRGNDARGIRQLINSEVAEAGTDWPPFKVGLFDGNPDRFNAAETKVDQLVQKLSWY